jgi:hypothetical protein
MGAETNFRALLKPWPSRYGRFIPDTDVLDAYRIEGRVFFKDGVRVEIKVGWPPLTILNVWEPHHLMFFKDGVRVEIKVGRPSLTIINEWEPHSWVFFKDGVRVEIKVVDHP